MLPQPVRPGRPGLEEVDPASQCAAKAAIFTRRVVAPPNPRVISVPGQASAPERINFQCWPVIKLLTDGGCTEIGSCQEPILRSSLDYP
jgi:hypothetical protein